jgi:hypothetical protein
MKTICYPDQILSSCGFVQLAHTFGPNDILYMLPSTYLSYHIAPISGLPRGHTGRLHRQGTSARRHMSELGKRRQRSARQRPWRRLSAAKPLASGARRPARRDGRVEHLRHRRHRGSGAARAAGTASKPSSTGTSSRRCTKRKTSAGCEPMESM